MHQVHSPVGNSHRDVGIFQPHTSATSSTRFPKKLATSFTKHARISWYLKNLLVYINELGTIRHS